MSAAALTRDDAGSPRDLFAHAGHLSYKSHPFEIKQNFQGTIHTCG